MVKSISQILFFLLLPSIALIVTNCSDDEREKEINFTLKFSPEFDRVKKCEVIILSANNKVLERSVIATASTASFHVTAPTDKINLVIIDSLHFRGGGIRVRIQAFYHVLPVNWDINTHTPVVQLPKTTPSSVTYSDMPPISDSRIYFSSNKSYAWVSDNDEVYAEYHSDMHFARFYYNKTADDYTYMVIPSLAKYKFKKMESTAEALDASVLEDAKKVKLSGTPGVKYPSFHLIGYPEKDNHSVKLELYPEIEPFMYGDFDFVAPENHFANYELFYSADTNWITHDYHIFSDKIPEAVNLFKESEHTMTQKDLQLNFSFTNKIPTAVQMSLSLDYPQGHTDLFITCPPKIASIKYSDFLKSLHSNMIIKLGEYDLKLNQYTLIKVSGLDYVGYQNHLYSTAPKSKLTEETFFSKSF